MQRGAIIALTVFGVALGTSGLAFSWAAIFLGKPEMLIGGSSMAITGMAALFVVVRRA